nr:hypothetical protein BaRGS_004779 [Batillaria attramentaria]
MRRWSRAVAALCVVYLLALVVFHHHLEPRNNPLSDDYVDGRDYTMPAPLAASHNNSIVKVCVVRKIVGFSL